MNRREGELEEKEEARKEDGWMEGGIGSWKDGNGQPLMPVRKGSEDCIAD